MTESKSKTQNSPVTPLKAIRGMNDMMPQDTPKWQHVERVFAEVLASYGVEEIRFPIVESTALFKRSIGEVTDIVEKEMYTFLDRNGDSLTLRPEGTACCVRAGIENGLFYNQTQRLWYIGPMFRHERPQKGRYRQFHQLGVEAFGFEGPDIDAELIAISHQFWVRLGIKDVVLEINSLGTADARAQHKEALVDYLKKHHDQLDEDSKQRLERNPLRILDSKNPDLEPVLANAPKLMDYLDEASRAHFEGLQQYLKSMGIEYVINPRLVRGLDYYSKTVFEWKTNLLGAQGTICAGGRYDGLVEMLGGKPTTGVGFALGLERVIELMDVQLQPSLHAYMIVVGENASACALSLAEELRNEVPALRLITHCGGGKYPNQFKKADKSGARLAIVLGDDEINKGTFGVKWLREDKPQQSLPKDELVKLLKELC